MLVVPDVVSNGLRVQHRSIKPQSPRKIWLPLDNLRPTQVAVGMRTVEMKRRKLVRRAEKSSKIRKFLDERPIPSVRGPGGALYIVDHHHLSLALRRAEIEAACVHVIADHSALSEYRFLKRMEADGRLYPFDEHGRRVCLSQLPERLDDLRHDPYRDLAWSVREAGGYSKSPAHFAEFLWADYFRSRISARTVRHNYEAAVTKAMKLAQLADATSLPGYCGPRPQQRG